MMKESLLADTTISHYRIINRLGSGGMGEVYLAEDVRLDRKVALKVLPESVASDQKRMRRFVQESKLASSLSHPNICIIHEVGETEDSRPFIAMEYVEGQTLDERIRRQPLTTEEIIGFSLQIADALDEAHSKGITHRDIKPANIIITPRGQVKVLDFGLAKSTRTEEETGVYDATTQVKTEPGMVMGTVQYMSPEQSLGRDTDHRSDIFSLGVVMYEMATGRRPFTGESATEVIDKIVHAQPEAIARLNYDAPADLERIIKKALRKNRDERYQNAKDLIVDLRVLKHELEFEEHTLTGASAGPATGGRRSDLSARTSPGLAATTTDAAHSGTSSVTRATAAIKRHRAAASLLALSVVAAGAYAIYKLSKPVGPPAAPAAHFQKTRVTRLTTSGNVMLATISPDGKFVAYATYEDDTATLWVRQVATTNTFQISSTRFGYRNLFFSRDGNFLYYMAVEDQSRPPTLYQVSAFGGQSKKIIRDVYVAAVSHDGQRLAFVRPGAANEVLLMVSNADGGGERQLLSMKLANIAFGLTWSLDGGVLAYAFGDDFGKVRLMTVEVSSGRQTAIPGPEWSAVENLEWLADGTGLLAVAMARSSPNFQVWEISYPTGEARPVISDLNWYASLGVTADSSAFVTVQRSTVNNVWTLPVDDPSRATAITSGTNKYYDLAWTPDGKILYASDASGSADIWVMQPDGTGQKRLTAGEGNNYAPAASPDGRHIFFHSNRTGIYQIWRVDADGSNPKQVTSGELTSNWPQCTSDGKWLIYIHAQRVYRMPLEGGEPVPVTQGEWATAPVISPDGKMIAYYTERGLTVTSVDTWQVIKSFQDIPPATDVGEPQFTWAGDSRALIYNNVGGGVGNLWVRPLDGKASRQLTGFKTDRIFSMAASRDGKRLAVSRGNATRDLILVTEQK